MTPYEVSFGPKLLSMNSYLIGTSQVQEIDYMFHAREAILHTLKLKSSDSSKSHEVQAFQHHSKHSFVEGDQVFLHLQLYIQISLKNKLHFKIESKFYGYMR